MQKITPYLWFDTQAEEAANFYTSLFPDSAILEVSRYPEGSPIRPGEVMTVSFRLHDQEFVALNGGPEFKFTEAISFVVACETQDEVDRLWDALTEGGEEQPCGWLKDRYGLSWQIIPSILDRLLGDKDAARAQRVMEAMLQMRKMDIKALQDAYEGV